MLIILELRVLVLTKRHMGSGNEIALFYLIVTRIINYVHREYQGSFKPRKLKEILITLFFSMIFPVVYIFIIVKIVLYNKYLLIVTHPFYTDHNSI